MAQILVVDPDRAARAVIERTLRRDGHEVVHAVDRQQAIRQIGVRTVDLAVVEQAITGGGLSLLGRLRELQPACLRVLMCATRDHAVVEGALDSGQISCFLPKPGEPARISALVGEVLARRQRMAAVVRVQQMVARKQERLLLREFVEGDYVTLALQPIIAVDDRRVIAYECLLRSSHPVFDGPRSVFQVAGRHGMLPQVGRLVVARAVEWFAQIPDTCQLFINVHADELTDPEGLVDRLAPLSRFGRRVVLEISDRAQLEGIEHWERAVALIGERGFAVAVDNLGAGYSSLAVLAELRPRFMKIDISIVRGVDTDYRKQRLVRLLARLASATGARLVAEGVETDGELGTLRACGALLQQGYLLGRPTQSS